MASSAEQPQWWVPSSTESQYPEITGLRNLVESIGTMHGDGFGRVFWVPFKAPAQRAWDDALAWLEARDAAAQEWPWPEYRERSDAEIEEAVRWTRS